MPQDNTKDNLKAETVVAAGDHLLYCLGAHQGYLLHLSDIFLILWLVSNLVESLF